MPTPRRLLFGEVADLYDRSRPSYPDALVDDLLAEVPAWLLEAGPRALEVGAGTGKATTMFASRGAGILAIEPSAEMAAVLRRNCTPYPRVEIVESDFERWDPGGESFPLLYSAQAWHWLDPAARLERARSALAPGGLLAAFWNRPAWGVSRLRSELVRVYAEVVPELEPDGPLHPANESVDEDDWEQEVDDAGGFDGAQVRFYEYTVVYSGAEYVALLGTLSEIRLLQAPRREALLKAVGAAIARDGGRLEMPMRTRLCTAQMSPG